MRLLGERNWYLPRWLAWLPNVQVEGQAPQPPLPEPRPAKPPRIPPETVQVGS
jgi:putative drug exporter of the RND superfamily